MGSIAREYRDGQDFRQRNPAGGQSKAPFAGASSARRRCRYGTGVERSPEDSRGRSGSGIDAEDVVTDVKRQRQWAQNTSITGMVTKAAMKLAAPGKNQDQQPGEDSGMMATHNHEGGAIDQESTPVDQQALGLKSRLCGRRTVPDSRDRSKPVGHGQRSQQQDDYGSRGKKAALSTASCPPVGPTAWHASVRRRR